MFIPLAKSPEPLSAFIRAVVKATIDKLNKFDRDTISPKFDFIWDMNVDIALNFVSPVLSAICPNFLVSSIASFIPRFGSPIFWNALSIPPAIKGIAPNSLFNFLLVSSTPCKPASYLPKLSNILCISPYSAEVALIFRWVI